MHGWISLPAIWYWVFLFVAPVLGLAVGLFNYAKRQVLLWLLVSCGYSVFVVLFAFAYEHRSHQYQDGYNLFAWSLLVIPVLLFALPATGVPWVVCRTFVSLRNDTESSNNPPRST